MGLYITFDGGSGVGKGTIIRMLKKALEAQGRSVGVIEESLLDPLRSYGAKILEWSKAAGKDKHATLLPLFAVGKAMMMPMIEDAVAKYDFALQDRSFVSSLAYQTSSGCFTMEQLWALYVDTLSIRIPDLAIIVDAEPTVAMTRVEKRPFADIGLGGKVSGDLANREKIRKNFLAIPNLMSNFGKTLIVKNDGEYTEDAAIVSARLQTIRETILGEIPLEV